MIDPRLDTLAEVLLGHSCALETGEKLLIEAIDAPDEVVATLVRKAAERGAHPLVTLKRRSVLRELLRAASREQMELWAEAEAVRMAGVDAYLAIHADRNAAELSDVPPERMKLYREILSRRVHREIRDRDKRWVALRWPGPSLAQMSGRSTARFEDYFYRVCAFDYPRLGAAMEPLRRLLRGACKATLSAPGTDLTFGLEGMDAVLCDGRHNLPDGEVYTAPVRESVQGKVRFNTPSRFAGSHQQWVELYFENGRVVEADGSDPQGLRRILDLDEGARCLGEVAVGCHPLITEPMGDTLFDEKIGGSVHLALGQSLEGAHNGNTSQIHWDLVLRLRPDQGGGQLDLDGQPILIDGRFAHPELEALNAESWDQWD